MLNTMRPPELSTGPGLQVQFPRPPKSLMKAVNGKRESVGTNSEDKTPYRAVTRPHGPLNNEGTVPLTRRPSQPGGRRQLHDSVDQVSNFRARLGAVLRRLIANRDVLTLCSLFAWGRMTITIKDANNELSELWKPKRADVIALFTHVFQKKAEYFAEFPEYDFVFEDATGAVVSVAQFEADTNDFHAMQQELDKHWGVHKRRLCPALRKPSAVARPVTQCTVAPTPSQPPSQVSSPHNGASATQTYFKPGAFSNTSQYCAQNVNGRPTNGYPNFAGAGSASYPLLSLANGSGANEDSPNFDTMSSPDANSVFNYGFGWDGAGDEVLNDSFDGSRLFDGLNETQQAESAESLQQASDPNKVSAATGGVVQEENTKLPQFMFGGGSTNMFLGGRSASGPLEGMNLYDHKFTLPNFGGEINFDRRDSSATLPDGSLAGGDMSTTMSLDGSVHHTPAQTPKVQSPIMGAMSQTPFLDLQSSHVFNLQVPEQANGGMNFPRRHSTPASVQNPQPQNSTDGAQHMPHPTLPFPMSFPLPGVPFPGAGQMPPLSLLSPMAHPSSMALLLSQMAAAAPGGMMQGNLPGMPPLMGGLSLALLDPAQQAAHLQNLEAQLRALQAQHPDHQQAEPKREDNSSTQAHVALQNSSSAMSLTPTSFSPPGNQGPAQQPQAPHPSEAASRDLAAALRAHHIDQAAMMHYHQAMIAMQMQLLHAQVGAAAGLAPGMPLPLPVPLPGMLGFPPQVAGWPMGMPGAVPPEALIAHLHVMREQMAAALQNQDPAQLAQMARMMGMVKPEMEDRPAR